MNVKERVSLFGFFAFLLVLSSSGLFADQAQDVQQQIDFTKQRLDQDKAELSSALQKFAAAPSAEIFARTRLLQENIKKEKRILDQLNIALGEARAASSWKALVSDMVQQSTVMSTAASALESVYNAGKWVFGPSLEDIYGPTWREAESMQSRLVEEARKVREEAMAIAKGLEQIRQKVEAGQGDQEIQQLQADMVKRLGELQERKEKIKNNLKLMVRVYKAEKQNLPASAIFWGDTMGRYIDQVLKEVDLGRLVDMAIDLAEGNLIKPLVKLIKPMIKTAIGDYFAKAKGGSALTNEIIDDLVFGILFKEGGAGGIGKALEDKLKSKATGKLVEGVVVGTLTAEAQVLTGKASAKAYEIMKNEIDKLPVTGVVQDVEIARQTADQLAKQNAKAIEASATKKIDAMKKTGKIIKDLWDLVFKDVVQAYMNSGTFTDTIKTANDACLGWREQYRKDKDDMIVTEDEYVNSKWFSGGRTMPAGKMPPDEADPLVTQKQEFQKLDPEGSAKAVEEFKDFVKEASAPGEGGTDLGTLAANEGQLFDLVLAGKMPFSAMQYANAPALAMGETAKPCEEYSRQQSKILTAKSEACQKLFRADTIAEWQRCWEESRKMSEEYTKNIQACYAKVSDAFKGFAEARAGRIKGVYKKIEEDALKTIQLIRSELEPAIAWSEANRSEFEDLKQIYEKIGKIEYIQPLDDFPDLPAGLVAGPAGGAEYDQAKNTKRLDVIRKAVELTKGFDPEKAQAVLDSAQFSWPEMSELINANSWITEYGAPILVYEPAVNLSLSNYWSSQLSWTSIGGDYTVIQLTNPKEVRDPGLAKQIKTLYQINPDEFARIMNGILQVPAAADPGFYGKLADFSLDKALSLHKQALAAHESAMKVSAAANQKLQEFAKAGPPPVLFEILNYYRIYFEPWKIIRKTNPGLAAQRLMKNTEEFKQDVDKFEKKYQGTRQASVQADPDSLKQLVQEMKNAVLAYERAFDQYYGYLEEFFPNRKFPEFAMPDILPYEIAAQTARVDQESAAIQFKETAKAMEEMKKALSEMEAFDRDYVANYARVISARKAVADKAKAFAEANEGKPDLVLKEIAKAKDELDKTGVDWVNPDHKLPPSAQKSADPMAMGAARGELMKLEEKFLERLKKQEEEDRFTGYRIMNPSLNGRQLTSARGEITLMPDNLEQGKIRLMAGLSHIDGIEAVSISSDGGQTWSALPVDPSVRLEISPAPGTRYDILLKIRNKLGKEFQLRFFENVTAIVYQNVSYMNLASEAVGKLATAYEKQDVAGFAALISRDFIGNRTFLEEGVRFDFDMFLDIRLKIYIDRIEKRGDMYVVETHWEKSQNPRKTGGQQMTTGKTVMMFVMEDGTLKIKNLRGNLLYATLSPEMAQASGLSQKVIEEIRVAQEDRVPVQPGAGQTVADGGAGTGAAGNPPRTGTATMNDVPTHVGMSDGFDFSSGAVVDGSGQADIYLETNIIWPNGPAAIQTSAQSYDALTEAPEGGYGSNAVDGSSTGATAVFITQEGYYGKMQVTGHTDDGSANTSTTFRYAVQTDGTRNLKT